MNGMGILSIVVIKLVNQSSDVVFDSPAVACAALKASNAMMSNDLPCKRFERRCTVVLNLILTDWLLRPGML